MPKAGSLQLIQRRRCGAEEMAMAIQIMRDDYKTGDYSMYFHVDVRLTKDFVCQPEQNELVKKLLEIHGVQEATVDRYKVRVERSKVVAWEAIIDKVEGAIREYAEVC
ncbi:MAG: NifU N-terminal domain-containing protein [Candidatus Sungbacteria bacterium]|nr:NifU N-terminal domain-containing protein [Candidatus Sungbacteria bacterium]